MSPFVSFGVMARELCGHQAQYVSRCIDGRHGLPNLGEGLRFLGRPEDYHDVKIHRDDVDEFVRRYKAYTIEDAL